MCAAPASHGKHVVNTLKASADFQRVSRLGKKTVWPGFIMLALRHESAAAPFRYGLTVSRKVGNAVVRNRVKRRLRALVRLSADPARLAGIDLVLIGRTAAANRDFQLMRQDFLRGLEKLERAA